MQIASLHGRWLPNLLARAAGMYLGAYNNIFNWEMETNGELRALKLVLQHVDGEVFDVGANAGQWATVALPLLADRRLHCFEPVPAAYAELIRTVRGSERVTLNPFGLSDTTGTIDINFSAKATTISSSYDLIFPDPEQLRIPCRFMTGDDYIAEHDVGAVAFVKIDVEGMEMAVLTGLANAFGRGAVAAIQFEHGASHILSGHTLKSFVDMLTGHGFDLFFIFPRSLERVEYSFELENYGGQNLLAVRRDVLPRLNLASS